MEAVSVGQKAIDTSCLTESNKLCAPSSHHRAIVSATAAPIVAWIGLQQSLIEVVPVSIVRLLTITPQNFSWKRIQ